MSIENDGDAEILVDLAKTAWNSASRRNKNSMPDTKHISDQDVLDNLRAAFFVARSRFGIVYFVSSPGEPLSLMFPQITYCASCRTLVPLTQGMFCKLHADPSPEPGG